MRVLFVLCILTLVGCSRPSVKIGTLEVMTEDLDTAWDLEEAKEICASLGDGWRLPTIEELMILCQNRDNIGDFNTFMPYWSSTVRDIEGDYVDLPYPLGLTFPECRTIVKSVSAEGTMNVRAVRTVKP